MKFEVNPGPCSQPTRKSNRNPPTIVLPIDDDDDDDDDDEKVPVSLKFERRSSMSLLCCLLRIRINICFPELMIWLNLK